MGKKIIVFFIIGFWILGFAFSRTGQTGSINGVVKTSEGESLPGVIVLLRSPTLILPEIEDVTNAAGMYRFKNLHPGVYELTFILAGFQKIVKKDIEISSGTTVSFNIDHTLRASGEIVIVEAKEPIKQYPIDL
jgi:hypothetical protein